MDFAKRLAILTAAAAILPGCTLVRTVVYNFPGLDDERVFASRTIDRPAAAAPLRALIRTPQFLVELRVPDGEGGISPIDEYLDQTRTAAFVVLHEDRIAFERYAHGHDARSLLNSFSISKAVVGTLVGIALAEGRITSLDDPVVRYRPEFAGTAYGAVTLRRLLTMTSGVVDAPTLLPSGAAYYYGADLHALTARAVARSQSQNRWHYSDADVQMLGFVLEGAVGKTVSAYLAEKLWRPLGMEAPAQWSLDREEGVEKAFCCIRARARDFARFGRLFLHGGRWNGTQVLPAEWAARTVLPGVATGFGDIHRHLWWSRADGEGDFYAYGHKGQYLYVNPTARTVIVKFSETKRQDPVPMFRAIADALKSRDNTAELDRLSVRTVALR